MSLKDRLNNQNKTVFEKKPETVTKYYETDDNSIKADFLGALEPILGDEDLNSIYVSGAKNVYIQRKGKISKSTSVFRDNVQLENILKKIAQNSGIEFSEKKPFFKFNKDYGLNAYATLPPLSSSVSLYVKCYKDKHALIQRLMESQSISKEIALVLEGLASIKKNIIITGKKSSQKTTLLSALAKKIPAIQKAAVIDFSQELLVSLNNITNYDFSLIDDCKTQNDILDMILKSGHDKIFVNDPGKNTIVRIVDDIFSGNNSFVITTEAQNPKSVLKKLAVLYMNSEQNLSYSDAYNIICTAFDIVITTRLDSNGKRKLDSIDEIADDEDEIKNVFAFSHLNEHSSSGIIPKFYEDFKEYSLPVSVNIFDIEYKHTYYKNYSDDVLSQFSKKSANAEILKKFKKELPTEGGNIEEQNEKQDDIQTGQFQNNDSPIEQNNNDISDLEVNEENNNEIQPEENINLEDDKNV